jgi:hypothetical protein
MAANFGTSFDDLSKELCSLILSDQVKGKIDSNNKVKISVYLFCTNHINELLRFSTVGLRTCDRTLTSVALM